MPALGLLVEKYFAERAGREKEPGSYQHGTCQGHTHGRYVRRMRDEPCGRPLALWYDVVLGPNLGLTLLSQFW